MYKLIQCAICVWRRRVANGLGIVCLDKHKIQSNGVKVHRQYLTSFGKQWHLSCSHPLHHSWLCVTYIVGSFSHVFVALLVHTRVRDVWIDDIIRQQINKTFAEVKWKQKDPRTTKIKTTYESTAHHVYKLVQIVGSHRQYYIIKRCFGTVFSILISEIPAFDLFLLLLLFKTFLNRSRFVSFNFFALEFMYHKVFCRLLSCWKSKSFVWRSSHNIIYLSNLSCKKKVLCLYTLKYRSYICGRERRTSLCEH